MEAAVVVVQPQVADLLNFFQPVNQGVPVEEELTGRLGHIAVVGEVDPQGLDIIGFIDPVVVEQHLKILVVQYNRALLPVDLAEHL